MSSDGTDEESDSRANCRVASRSSCKEVTRQRKPEEVRLHLRYGTRIRRATVPSGPLADYVRVIALPRRSRNITRTGSERTRGGGTPGLHPRPSLPLPITSKKPASNVRPAALFHFLNTSPTRLDNSVSALTKPPGNQRSTAPSEHSRLGPPVSLEGASASRPDRVRIGKPS